MAKRDYYDVLGVSRSATPEEIKKAYRKLAVQFHPDKTQGDKAGEEKFKEATEAYEVLASEEKRKAYDQYGFAGVESMGGAGGDYSDVYRNFEDIFGDFSNIFGSFFGGSRSSGGGRRRSQPVRGADLRYDLQIDFKDAVFGTKAEIAYSRSVPCDECSGTGSEKAGGRKTCPSCHGSGQVRQSSGFFSIASVCPTCSGEGTVIEHPCRKCRGTGLESRNQRIKVNIPAGIESGKRLNIPGQGESPVRGGEPGDLYVFIQVRPHEFFERDGLDLYCVIPIDIAQASLGAEISIPTIEEKRIKVRVPAGTQSGTLLRVKGEGVPTSDGKRRGDLYLKIQVQIPRKLSGKARQILEEFATVEGQDNEPSPIPLKNL